MNTNTNIQTDREFLSLKEYRNIVYKIMLDSKYSFLLKDNDFVGEAMNKVIEADIKWNGKGSLYGYRKQKVLWMIKSYIMKHYRYRSKEVFLSQIPTLDNACDSTYDNPIDSLLSKEIQEIVYESVEKCCTNHEKYCFYMIYKEGLSQRELSDKLEVTQQAVSKTLKKIYRKLKPQLTKLL